MVFVFCLFSPFSSSGQPNKNRNEEKYNKNRSDLTRKTRNGFVDSRISISTDGQKSGMSSMVGRLAERCAQHRLQMSSQERERLLCRGGIRRRFRDNSGDKSLVVIRSAVHGEINWELVCSSSSGDPPPPPPPPPPLMSFERQRVLMDDILAGGAMQHRAPHHIASNPVQDKDLVSHPIC